MKYISLSCIASLCFASAAYSADAPNIVGNWKATTGAYSTTGTEAKKAASVLSQQPWHAEIKVAEQKGRAFNGVTKRPDGSELLFAGVFASNGKNFSISSDRGILTGVVEGGKMEYCGTTISAEYNLAFCSTLEKSK